MRRLPEAMHTKLEIMAAKMRVTKEVVVTQALEIGVSFLEEAIDGGK